MLDIFIAAIAGFVSFISPCVLPLVPAYIGYMGGRVTNTVSAQVSVGAGGSGVLQSSGNSLLVRFSTFLHGIAFVLGFTFIFVTLGIISTAFFSTFGSTSAIEGVIARVGGILIIFFGLHFMGIVQPIFRRLRQMPAVLNSPLTTVALALILIGLISWGFTGTLQLWDTSLYAEWTGAMALGLIAVVMLGLFTNGAFTEPGAFLNRAMNTVEVSLYADTRRQMQASGNRGLAGSAIMGVVFGAGWSPCIGPTLGLALTMAANGGDVAHAATLMTAYSLGLGIPFLLTALMLDSAQGGLRRLKTHMNTIKVVSGAFLVFIGFVIASGTLQNYSRQFSTQFGETSIRIEECIVGAIEGDIGLSQTWPCLNGDEDFRVLKAAHLGTPEILLPVSQDTTAEVSESDGGLLGGGAIESIETASGSIEFPIGLEVGNLAPNFSTVTTDGQEVSLRDYEGDIVLLNFWFTECAPCRIEMPEFQAVYEEYADQGLTILAVNREESAEAVEAFSAEMGGLTFPLLLDEEGDIQAQYSIFGYPSTFVLDRNGVILYRSFSALTESQIRELVEGQFS